MTNPGKIDHKVSLRLHNVLMSRRTALARSFHSSRRWLRQIGRPQLLIGLALVSTMEMTCIPVGSAQQPAARQTHDAELIDQVQQLIRSGRTQDALSLLQQANLHGSHASEVHTLKGICFAVSARPIESVDEFDQAIALRPNFAPTYFSSGLAAASFNNLDRALSQLATALRIDPDLPGIRYNYALVLARAGKYAESETQVDLELAGNSPKTEAPVDLWKLKARDAYYRKRWQDAIGAYNKVLVVQPNWAEAYACIGEALYALNSTQESEIALRKALAIDPSDGGAHRTLGKLYQDDGKDDEAIAQFEADIQTRPEDQEAVYRLLRLYKKRGDTANVSRTQKQIQDLFVSRAAASVDEAKATELNNSGIVLEQKGDLAGALENYDQASKIDVTNIIFQRNAALLLCKMGRMQEAIRRLRDILLIDAEDAETLQILSVANELASGDRAKWKDLPTPQSMH
ncbi:Flp pilus assembly protein TadD [Edaphobacter aggregans]|uniref:Flp pilus assembly protein TadD n=1 Tax=Edaphobacter aggregans TaxID=570835 RepID=A0A3R9P099_9BACT|nr:tetratricopeptide repeat protein [Edaphobacter aggregans]RSL18998.1 Flp pilus assembly protein TadD [Edaphobacter aggregans]